MGDPAEAQEHRPWLAQYPAGVPKQVEIPPLLIPEWIGAVIRDHPKRTALLHYGRRWTYAQLGRESGSFAAALAADGVAPGDRVALYLPNSPAYVVAFLGILRAGATVVQVSPLYLGRDLAELLADAKPAALVTLEILYPQLAAVRAGARVPRVYVARTRDFYPALKRPFVPIVLRRHGRSTAFPTDPEVRSYAKAIANDGPAPDPSGDPATTVAVLQYTGGTTGVAKGAMLSHRNLIANATQLGAWNLLEAPGEERILAAIPFFHIYGLTVALLYGLAHGDTIVLETRPDLPEMLRLIGRYRPTQLPGVPALYRGLLNQPNIDRYDLRSIKFCMSGSAPLPVDLLSAFEARTGARLIEGYGLSEASPATHANPVRGDRRAGSIGLPLPGTDARIVDPERSDRPLGPDEVGELAVRGPQVMLGYYGRPDESARVLRDGWLLTGDLARIDPDGWAYLVDRKKDLIIVGGFKVYPREVEETLGRHPAVQEAAVVGLADAELGEVVRAFVVLRPGRAATEAELIAYVRGEIAHYKAPRSIVFKSELPRSGIQKVLRRALREEGLPAPTGPGR